MPKRYSIELSESAIARVRAGEGINSIAESLGVSASSVINWAQRKRSTGSMASDQAGGHRPHTVASHSADSVSLQFPPVNYHGTILLAQPRSDSASFLMEVLRAAPWKALQIYGETACIEHATKYLPDLIVVNGASEPSFAIDLVRAIRSHEILSQIGVLVVDADDADEIQALEAGADDFITMPLPRQKFLLRAEGVVRRTRFTERFLRYADIAKDVDQSRVLRNGDLIELGGTQFRLLQHFLTNPEQVFSHEELGSVIWSNGAAYRNIRSIYAYVHVLREQLNAGGRSNMIRTERGGYWLKDHELLISTENFPDRSK